MCIGREDLVILRLLCSDRSIWTEDFAAGRAVSRRYRNRRIGEFLKEPALTEARSTAVPKILKAHPLAAAVEGDTGQVTGQVTPEVARSLCVLVGEMSRQALQLALSLKHRDHFNAAYLKPALGAAFVEMTHPEAPRSSKQRYRLTEAGRQALGESGKR